MSTFLKVCELNLAFGNKQGNLETPDWVALRKQAMLCLEEAKEMLEAVEKQDMEALMDAQGDLTTVNDGVAFVAGFNGDAVYDLVHQSNMTKFIQNEDEVAPALKYYYDKGFKKNELRIEGEFPQVCIKVAVDTELNGKFYPKGKFLKNMLHFKEPDFSSIGQFVYGFDE